ncbi:glycoside hydrolase family 2 TIM barrel-domain containing protein [Paenibacillus sp. GD4]|jgi:beta-galactosidase|uniref:glycoside hydrolase family 2 protein n=1 Tax=Paenibacillus sp. GD4 TaxID=3068890 RepID=UPI0027968EC2|nr:glycoside hydrolase family 2 TIM barrel-domain containing protein [Paenibacillus sp. GD4]MDQ1914126.1 glycoside hydrolase family 2 TIM barrel-domain containing protein [Paenibacillus sp. GD4]
MTSTIPFNDNWTFTRNHDPIYASELIQEGQSLTLPHTWNAADYSAGYFRGQCWYQKTLKVSPEEVTKRFYLEIGAAGNSGAVYINGNLVGESRCGYAMFRAPLTPHIKAGDNLISIMVDNRFHKDVFPIMADFTFYGGLYREVKLHVMEDVHFDVMDNGRDGVYITQAQIGPQTFEMAVEGQVINESTAPVKGTVQLRLNDQDGTLVLEAASQLTIKDVTKFSFRNEIGNPILWDGVERPYLYTATVTIAIDGQIRDSREIEIGFRTIEVSTDKGLLLNGKPVKLNGVCRHQDFGGVGNAITREHMDRDMALIREVGANSVRLAHYQHDDYFYSLCDRNGILVWAEIPFISRPSTQDPENQNAVEQLEKLIKQSYNHCSIYCWGVQNEITIAVETEHTHRSIQKLVELAKRLDPSRFTTQANINGVEDDSVINTYTDLVGYNLYYGWYYGELADMAKRFDSFHAVNPNTPLILSEYGADTNPKFHTYSPDNQGFTEEFQLVFQQNALDAIEARPFVIGGYVWNMFDFGSAIRNEGGVVGINQKGLVSMDRTLKKDAFYLHKAYWSKEPFVHLAGRRFANRHREQNDIVVLTNLHHIRVYVNQVLLADMKSYARVKTVKDVALSPGDNVVKVEGMDEQGTVYTDEIQLSYVTEADPEYIYAKKEHNVYAVNWFDKFDLSNPEVVDLKDGYYSTYDTIEDLYHSEAAKAVFLKYFEHVTQGPRFESSMDIMSIQKMAQLVFYQIPPELLKVIDKELNAIPKPF